MAGAASPDSDISELLGIFLVIFNMLVGAALSTLERRLISRHAHLRVVLRNLYRELLILGLVSFLFVLYATIFEPTQEVFVSFEFAHLLIFVLAIFYTAVVFVTAATSLSMSRHWKAIEAMDLLKYLMYKSKFAELKAMRTRHRGLVWRWLLWWRGDVRQLKRYHEAHTVLNFHDIRFQFLYYRDLPAEFNFSAYLRKIKSSTFIELVEPHWTIWTVILTLLVVDLLRRKYRPSATLDRAVLIGSSLFLWILSEFLRLKISRVHWALFKHPATYYDEYSSKISRGTTLADMPAVSPVADAAQGTDSAGADSGAETSGHEADVDVTSDHDTDFDIGRGNLKFPELPPPPSANDGGFLATAIDISEPLPSPPSTPGRRSLDRGAPPAPRKDVVLDMSGLSVDPLPVPDGNDETRTRSSIDMARRRSVTRRRPGVPAVTVPTPSAASILDDLFQEKKKGDTSKARLPRVAPAASSRQVAAERPAGPRKGPRTPGATTDEDGSAAGASSKSNHTDSDAFSNDSQSEPSDEDDGASASERYGSASARLPQRHSLELPDSSRSLGRRSLDAGPVRRGRIRPWTPRASERRSLEVQRARQVRRGGGGHVRHQSADAPPSSASSSRGARRAASVLSDTTVSSTRSSRDGRSGAGGSSRGGGGGPDSRRRSMELVLMSPPRHELEARHMLDGGLVVGDHSGRRLSVDAKPVERSAASGSRRGARDQTPRAVGGSSSAAESLRSSVEEGTASSTRDERVDGGSASGGGGAASAAEEVEVRMSVEAPVNHAMISRHRGVQEAQEKPPRLDFPAVLLVLIPRLRRRASPAEKLFWFGSHHLFLWLVEFNLFSSTLLASIAVAAYSTAAIKGKSSIESLDVAVLVLSISGLAYVLLRTAQSLKLYTFVLNCAGLVPEELALDAIGEIKATRKLRFSYCSDEDDESAAESRVDGDGDGEGSDGGERVGRAEAREAVKERRRKFWKFMATSSQAVLEDRSEAEADGGGSAHGGESVRGGSAAGVLANGRRSEEVPSRRQRLRAGLRRRRRREQREKVERRRAAEAVVSS